MKQPYEDCPQFDVCSCNICPLDPAMGSKEAMDGEEECKATRESRLKITHKYTDFKFLYRGLTGAEYNVHKRSLSMSGRGYL